MEYVLIMIVFLMIVAFFVPKYIRFKGSNYKVVSGNSFLKTIFNKGNYGEFLTFDLLEKLKGNYYLLTNVYIPKKDGTTTEIDLIMISEFGIYVFESKNYSGWIFGNEKSRNWTQTLPNKQKNRFFNPIWQNNSHIKALSDYIDYHDNSIYKSYIVFSERCTLKKITVYSPRTKVLKREQLLKNIKKEQKNAVFLLMSDEMNHFNEMLKPLTKVDEALKKVHVEQVKAKIKNRTEN
ncbi:nuclease-related domain-containing protein [Alkalihalobacillus sp. 1P02AB]|uniref:nuclease-related domain-containing protein n=1 Tax=Alkalihalobacillus sp. 1P02AB TaxID=3132260 RepID=UPI0039A6D822